MGKAGYGIEPIDYEGGCMISDGEIILVPGKRPDHSLESRLGLETVPTGLPGYVHVDLFMNAIGKGRFLYNRGALSQDIVHDMISFKSYRDSMDGLAARLRDMGNVVEVADSTVNERRNLEGLKGTPIYNQAVSRIPTLPVQANIISTGENVLVLRDQAHGYLDELGTESIHDMLESFGLDVHEIDWRLDNLEPWSPSGCFWRLGERLAGPRCMTLPLRTRDAQLNCYRDYPPKE